MKRENRKRNFCFTSLAVSMVMAASMPVYADQASGTGDLTVSLEYAGDAIASARVSLYYVGPWNNDGSWDYSSAFNGCSVSLSAASLDEKTADQLYEYVETSGISGLEAVTDAAGEVSYKDLGTGLYLVAQNGWVIDEPSYEEFEPFLVSVPFLVDNSYTYTVTAKPKTEKIPETETETETETESETESSAESVPDTEPEQPTQPEEPTPEETEPTVPDHTTAPEEPTSEVNPSSKPGGQLGDDDEGWSTAASGEESTGVIPTIPGETPSNRPGGQLGDDDSGHLPITGMVVWPITVFSILGMLFFIAGWVDNRRREEKERS